MEKIRTYDTQSLFRAAYTAKEATKTALDRGRPASFYSSWLIPKIDATVDLAWKMQETHSEWVNAKFDSVASIIQRMDYTPDKAAKRVKKEFAEGLRSSMAILTSVDPDFDKQDAIIAYTAGFIRMLRVTDEIHVAPNTALRLARFNNMLSADKYKSLIAGNPDLPLGVVTHAAINQARNTDGFLKSYRETYERLSNNKRYKELRNSLIVKASLKLQRGEAFLKRYQSLVKTLRANELYKGLPDGLIMKAAEKYPNKPEEFLNKHLEKKTDS